MHEIFVTAREFSTDLQSDFDGQSFGTGLEGADYRCQYSADQMNLGGSWKAVLSTTGTDARDRIPSLAGSLYNLHGDKVADDHSDLWDGFLDADIDADETGLQGERYQPMTGTLQDGTAASDNCGDWTTTSGNGERGYSRTSGSSWVESGTTFCGNNPFYCMSE